LIFTGFGFPLETDTLDFMQTAYEIFNALGKMAGNLAIISGCEAVGSQINNGTVYINGKLLSFRGGAVGTNVVIRQENTTRKFEDGNDKEVYQTRYACFGTGITMYPWVNFKQIKNLQKLQKETVPVGAIMMWAGVINAIPAGWKLCDGTNGTPDLRGRFIVGHDINDVDYDTIGETGGNKNITTSGIVENKSTQITVPASDWGVTGTSLSRGIKERLIVGSGYLEKGEKLESLTHASHNQSINFTHNHDFKGDTKDNRPPQG